MNMPQVRMAAPKAPEDSRKWYEKVTDALPGLALQGLIQGAGAGIGNLIVPGAGGAVGGAITAPIAQMAGQAVTPQQDMSMKPTSQAVAAPQMGGQANQQMQLQALRSLLSGNRLMG